MTQYQRRTEIPVKPNVAVSLKVGARNEVSKPQS